MDHKRDYGVQAPAYVALRAGDNSIVEHLATRQIVELGKIKAHTAERFAEFFSTAHALLGADIARMLVSEAEARARG